MINRQDLNLLIVVMVFFALPITLLVVTSTVCTYLLWGAVTGRGQSAAVPGPIDEQMPIVFYYVA
jgi:hypothetical protein